MDSPDTSPVEDKPLPDLSHYSLDKADLEQLQKDDPTLAPIQTQIGSGEYGYGWKDGLQIH